MGFTEDFTMCLGLTVALIIFRLLLSRFVLQPIFAPFGFTKAQLQSVCDHSAKMLYHGGLMLFGLVVVPQEEWFSWTSLQGVWHDFARQKQTDALKWYYFTQCGSAMCAFVFHFFEEKKKDYLPMLFHHVCSIGLILGSWHYGACRIGCMVLFSRELSDVCIHAAKVFNMLGSKYSGLAVTWFATLLITWVPLRLVLYPILIRSAIVDSQDAVAENPNLLPAWWACCIGLSTLVPLDWYWFAVGVHVAIRKMKTGKLVDSREVQKTD